MIKKSILLICFFLVSFVVSAESDRSEGYWNINGTTLHYVMMGDGEPIIALHGGPGGNLTSKLDLVQFAPGYRWIFFDQRGCGESDRFPVNLDSLELAEEFFSLDNYVKDIDDIRTLLGYDKITLLGHSWGGALAVFYATTHPDHVNKLIVYSGGPVWTELQKEKKAAIRDRTPPEINDQIAKIMANVGNNIEVWEQAKLDEEFIKMIAFLIPAYNCQPTTIPEPAEMGRGGFWANQLTNRYIQSFERDVFADRLKKIECPALIINGRCDPSPIERQTYLRDNIPNSIMIVFEESGHNAHQEQPVLFGELIRSFLADKPLPMEKYDGNTKLMVR